LWTDQDTQDLLPFLLRKIFLLLDQIGEDHQMLMHTQCHCLLPEFQWELTER